MLLWRNKRRIKLSEDRRLFNSSRRSVCRVGRRGGRGRGSVGEWEIESCLSCLVKYHSTNEDDCSVLLTMARTSERTTALITRT